MVKLANVVSSNSCTRGVYSLPSTLQSWNRYSHLVDGMRDFSVEYSTPLPRPAPLSALSMLISSNSRVHPVFNGWFVHCRRRENSRFGEHSSVLLEENYRRAELHVRNVCWSTGFAALSRLVFAE